MECIHKKNEELTKSFIAKLDKIGVSLTMVAGIVIIKPNGIGNDKDEILNAISEVEKNMLNFDKK